MISPTTPLMFPTCKSWNLIIMGGLDQTSHANAIFLFMAEVKARWRAILTRCLKNWMQKNKDKWSSNCLSWKKRTHSLMKQSISCLSVLCISMAIRIKWCPSWNLLYFQILAMVLSSTATPISWLMTLKATASRVGSITTTSAIKTWFSYVM